MGEAEEDCDNKINSWIDENVQKAEENGCDLDSENAGSYEYESIKEPVLFRCSATYTLHFT